ncbi:transglutaminase domain-containing protein [Bifidobacterium sp. SMB2]|uniref:Transglutaminase domain-containing protein n=1 Tax=Bifidobacterium saimiriisciurei TaxID=2661627 RepID=A0ABX0CB49_9BIFI|nr:MULTISPECIES: transglutaminase-like domain-containing protein [Bifidobacterium]NEG96757.1 transglutaminase domain-containing protein [Bifidobacterium sp. SMB2]NEH12323.1 transglutaminase domain-containing protein [Bifidobacterium saimiriisciurei]
MTQFTPLQDGTVTGTGTATGTWAESTHSAIWITRGLKGGDRLRGTALLDAQSMPSHLISLLVMLVTNLLAAANLIDVYGTIGMWALCALPAALIGVAVALAGLKTSLRLWWQLVFLLVAQFVVGPVIALQNTTIAHVIPSVDTLAKGASATFGAYKYLISIDPAVGTGEGDLMALLTIVLWMSFLSGVFALARKQLVSVLSLVAVAVNFAVCAALGTSVGVQPVAIGVVLALLLIVWLSWRMRLLEFNRFVSAILIVVIAAGAAVGASFAVGQDRQILRDKYEPPLSPYNYASPMSGMRAFVKNHKTDKLLTVRNLPAGTPVRLAVMDRFDGTVWNLSDSSESSDSSDYRRMGDTIGGEERANTKGERFTATFTVHNGLDDVWFPTAGVATSVRFGSGSASGDAESFYYNTDTNSGLLTNKVRGNLTYTEHGVVPAKPTDKQVENAQADSISQPETQDVPDSVGKLATSFAGGSTDGGAAAQRLADKLKDNGWFSHGLKGDYPSLPGHGAYRIDKLLAGSSMVGDSEQYASAMALMARELGLPSRVVLGFIPKNKDGEITDARTKTAKDGTTSIDFTGNDIEAWVEIKLDGYGWTAFYPTPKETKVPNENQNLTPPKPQNLVRQPPVPLQDPLRDENQTKGQSNLGGSDADDESSSLWLRKVLRVVGMVALYGSPLWLLLIVVGTILGIKAVMLSRARKRGDPDMRIAEGWRQICILARQSGVHATGTRREQSRELARQLALPQSTLDALSKQADYAAFSGITLNDKSAATYWNTVDQVRAAMLRGLPRNRRIRTKLSLKGVFADPISANPTHNGDGTTATWRASAWSTIRSLMAKPFAGRSRRGSGNGTAADTADADANGTTRKG